VCPERDSNPHPRRDLGLSQAREPFPPSGRDPVLQVICIIDTFLFCILAIWIPQIIMMILNV
jgi:hypothetical protein